VKLKLELSRRAAWIIFAILVLLLVAGTTMPNELKAEIEGRMWRKLPWSALAHYTLFMLLGMCPVYGNGRAAALRTIGVAVMLAVITETLQSVVPGRHPQMKDMAIDIAGTATALFLRRVLPPVRISS
jgi:VanZ family protein